jgi:hypothetical protein
MRSTPAEDRIKDDQLNAALAQPALDSADIGSPLLPSAEKSEIVAPRLQNDQVGSGWRCRVDAAQHSGRRGGNNARIDDMGL